MSMAEQSAFEKDLPQNAANHVPLTPVSFLQRAAAVRPQHTAIIHGNRRYSYAQFWQRSCALAAGLKQLGIARGDCVAAMCSNTPEMLELHNAVPMLGAVLNSLNIRLDAETIAFILNHGEAKAIITDTEFSATVKLALEKIGRDILVIDIDDPEFNGTADGNHDLLGSMDYETLLEQGMASDGNVGLEAIEDEWQSLSLLYTSGTTGNPKGCVYHHRGAYLNALGNLITMGLQQDSRYLWTLPMFHCDGWTFTWGVTAAMATHVCLRKVEAGAIFDSIEKNDVTHMCGAPIVLNMLANAPAEIQKRATRPIEIATGGAAPPSAVIEGMEAIGFNVTHLYGLTETYGPATVCLPQADWEQLDLNTRSARMSRQGVHYLTLDGADIFDSTNMQTTPNDSQTLGELMIRGNTVMKGYLKNPDATAEAFAGGWFHSGDLGVQHPDGYVEIKDRAKDIIISGGENISTLEVEEALYRFPKTLEAAVVAQPDERWGETPCAFVTLKDGEEASAEEVIEFCKTRLAAFKVPRHVVFGPLPKTSTGKIQKFALRETALNRSTQ